MSDDVSEVVDLASQEIDDFLATVDSSLGDVKGMVEPSSEQLAAFFFQMQTQYPPATFRYPDGHTVTASPWILALEQCENGKEWIDRFTRWVARNGGM